MPRKGASISSQMVSTMKKDSRNCQYLCCDRVSSTPLEANLFVDWSHVRLWRLPLPEVIGATALEEPAIVHAGKGDSGVASLGRGRRAGIESDLEQNDLDDDHHKRLDEKGDIEAGTGVVEYPREDKSSHELPVR